MKDSKIFCFLLIFFQKIIKYRVLKIKKDERIASILQYFVEYL